MLAATIGIDRLREADVGAVVGAMMLLARSWLTSVLKASSVAERLPAVVERLGLRLS